MEMLTLLRNCLLRVFLRRCACVRACVRACKEVHIM
jgi:hypothetical protein